VRDEGSTGARRGDNQPIDAGPPPGVADRLNALRSIHVAQGNAAVIPDLLGRERQVSGPTLAILVGARLRELRSLDELARYLHRGRIASEMPTPRQIPRNS
jgi:hypothetical protein